MNSPPEDDRLISPCIGLCVLDPQQEYCRGCWRTIDEISRWSRLTTEQKRDVLQTCDQRQASRESCGEGPN